MTSASADAPSTREALVLAAHRVIARSGFRTATARAITREAGVSLALIRYHFGTQDALLKATVEHAAAELFDVVERMAVAEDLAALTRVGMEFAREMPNRESLRVLFDATLHAQSSPWLQDWASQQIAELRALIAMKAPSHLPEEDRRALGLVLAALLDGALLHHWVDPKTDMQALARGAALLVEAVTREDD
ncbi:MAG: TetR family transcriptional regulator [Deltaproteobacteria bacterium]|nr:TetR family transcriptional regulator [Deltaproteobacteria bacterium]